MNDAATQPRDEQTSDEQRSWLHAEVDGRSVAFWIITGLTIAVVTLGLGAWWVWGLGQGMPIDDTSMDGMAMEDMPHTDARLPPVQGFYDGEEIFFVHPEASNSDVVDMLTEMMAGSSVVLVPGLAEVPDGARDDVYVFTNGIEGRGPFGFQPDVFGSAPGDDAYSPLRTVVLVTWRDEDQARELRSADQVRTAADAGEVDLERTDVVVNMPFLTWPDGQR